MKLRKASKKCPACGQIMTKRKNVYNCQECGTILVGDTQIRPPWKGEDWIKIWR